MTKKNALLYTAFGIWASGMLVGANAVDYLPGEPSWPTGLLLAIGIIASIGNMAAFYRMVRQPSHPSTLDADHR